MSVTAMGMALEAVGISPRAKVILIAISNCANEYTFEGYPSRRDLARIADCSIDTVDRCIRELADGELLSKSERDREDGKGQTSNLYRVFPAHDPSRKSAEGGRTAPGRTTAEGGQRISAAPQPQAYAAPPAAYCAAPKEPLSEPLEDVVVAVAALPVSMPMLEALKARADGAINLTSGHVHHMSELSRLVRGGCLWEDIEAATDSVTASFKAKGKRFHSWAVISELAIDIRDRRLAGVRQPEPPHVNGPRAPDAFGAGAGSAMRSKPRSAATIIMERALDDEVDEARRAAMPG